MLVEVAKISKICRNVRPDSWREKHPRYHKRFVTPMYKAIYCRPFGRGPTIRALRDLPIITMGKWTTETSTENAHPPILEPKHPDSTRLLWGGGLWYTTTLVSPWKQKFAPENRPSQRKKWFPNHHGFQRRTASFGECNNQQQTVANKKLHCVDENY